MKETFNIERDSQIREVFTSHNRVITVSQYQGWDSVNKKAITAYGYSVLEVHIGIASIAYASSTECMDLCKVEEDYLTWMKSLDARLEWDNKTYKTVFLCLTYNN